MTDPTVLASDYLALWNGPDDASRRERLDSGWTADARYADPMMSGNGRDGIGAMIADARAGFPGHAFAQRGTPDGYGDVVRFSWSLASGVGAPVAYGTDIVRLDENGRIAEVIGFIDGEIA